MPSNRGNAAAWTDRDRGPARSRRSAVASLACFAAALLIGAAACAPAEPITLATLAPQASPSATAGASPAAPTVARAAWSDCGGGYQCATIQVPEDYANPGGPRLALSVTRLPATAPQERIGALIVNPGGPGGSGVEFVRDDIKVFPVSLRRRFDIVGFDPRGVNLSSPVRCQDNLDGHVALDTSPDSKAELKILTDDAQAFAEACDQRNGELLAHLSTEDVARDLDLIRIAIGDAKISYFGFSYGTLIGAIYAQMFPDHIRAMVLDGALDPGLDLAGLRGGQARAFEAALGHFLADCAKDKTCYFHEGGRTRRSFDALMASIEKHPLPAIRAKDPRVLTTGLAWQAVAGAMYNDEAWPALAIGLALAKRGDGSVMLLLTDPYNGRNKNGQYSNLIDAYTANTCLDFPAPKDVAVYTALAAKLRPTAPHFASMLAYNDLTCAFWPVAAARKPAKVSADGAPPIVVVGTTGDPATPYEWAVSLAEQLSSGVLVTRRGEGHTGFAFSDCVRRAVTPYLLDLKAPRDGLTCD
jgi:pimeloyl-ACP methyl ester carboxylesterase